MVKSKQPSLQRGTTPPFLTIPYPLSPIAFPPMPTVRCPTCDRPVEWTESSRWRPFCSERCKLIDLGAWASGQRAIPGEEIKDEEEKEEE
jgi:endogenous inhibitor of DNA gyrase (YacG/DUF329 family)